MKTNIEHDQASPLFIQFKEHIVAELTKMALKPGDKIPSETVWCRNNNVSIRTVRRALSELEKDGVIARRQGLGSFLVDLTGTATDKAKGTIGILFSDMAFVTRPDFSALLLQIEGKVIDAGFSFHLYSTGNRFDKGQVKPLDGIIPETDLAGLIASSALNSEDITFLRRRKIPLVTFNDYHKLQFNTVRPDYYNAARKGIKYLLSQSHNILFFVGGKYSHDETSPVILNHDYFLQGIKDELKENGVTLDLDHVIEAPATRQGGFDAAINILSLKKDVDAILTTSFLQAEGALEAFKSKLPADNLPEILSFSPGNSQAGIKEMLLPIDEMADAAIKLLTKAIDGDAASKVKKVFDLEFANATTERED